MPHSLTDRQREVLQFIRDFIEKQESSPRLEDIAQHFNIKPPTAHKMLEALQSKGYLYFDRDSQSGFFIRLFERAGSVEVVSEILIVGRIDKLGEVLDFPTKLGHFATVTTGTKPDELFALVVKEDITQASILNQDVLIFDRGKKPQPGDICIGAIGMRLFLIKVTGKTFDQDITSFEMAQWYPIPTDLNDNEREQRLLWYPLAYDESTAPLFIEIAEQERMPVCPIPEGFVLATALRLIRFLAF